ncbi:MAG: hypothetical protein ACRYGG_03170 [Janthinobacterium lividum]
MTDEKDITYRQVTFCGMGHDTLPICPNCKATRGLLCLLVASPIYQCPCGTKWSYDYTQYPDGHRVRRASPLDANPLRREEDLVAG